MKKLLFVVLLIPCLAFAQGQKETVQMGKELLLTGMLCFSAVAMFEIVNTLVAEGPATAEKVFLKHGAKNTCIMTNRIAVTLTARVHRAEGRYGIVNVYRGTMVGQPVYIPANDGDVVEAYDCSPSSTNVCV